MVLQDKAKTKLDGSPDLLIMEVASLMSQIAKQVSEKSPRHSYDDVIDHINKILGVHKLVDSGMSPEGAVEIFEFDNT